MGSEPFGRAWQSGDVVGCMIDLTENHIMFTLNGEMLISDSGSELAFKDIEIGDGEAPRPGHWGSCRRDAGFPFGLETGHLGSLTDLGKEGGSAPAADGGAGGLGDGMPGVSPAREGSEVRWVQVKGWEAIGYLRSPLA